MNADSYGDALDCTLKEITKLHKTTSEQAEEITKLREQAAAQAAEIAQLKEQVKFVQSESFRTQAVSAQTFPTSAGDGDENTGNPNMYHESRNCLECLNREVDAQTEKIQAQAAVIEKLLIFVKYVSEQTPEKPDYWTSCGQCSSNSDEAEDLLAIPTDSTQILAEVRRAERERVAKFVAKQRNDIPMTGIECAVAIRAME